MTLDKLVCVVAIGLSVSGCKNFCDRESPCPGEARKTQQEKDSCNKTLTILACTPCVNEGLALLSCQQDNIACAADGGRDFVLSVTNRNTNCAASTTAYNNCCMVNRTSVACLGTVVTACPMNGG